MPSAFGKFLDAVADALGLSSDKSRQQTQPRAPRPDPPRPAGTQPPGRDAGPVARSVSGIPITADDCRVCGVRPAKPEHFNQFCSEECVRDAGDRLDAWHDQFEERFGEGVSYEEWRAELEERHGKDYLADIDKRAREKG